MQQADAKRSKPAPAATQTEAQRERPNFPAEPHFLKSAAEISEIIKDLKEEQGRICSLAIALRDRLEPATNDAGEVVNDLHVDYVAVGLAQVLADLCSDGRTIHNLRKSIQ